MFPNESATSQPTAASSTIRSEARAKAKVFAKVSSAAQSGAKTAASAAATFFSFGKSSFFFFVVFLCVFWVFRGCVRMFCLEEVCLEGVSWEIIQVSQAAHCMKLEINCRWQFGRRSGLWSPLAHQSDNKTTYFGHTNGMVGLLISFVSPHGGFVALDAEFVVSPHLVAWLFVVQKLTLKPCGFQNILPSLNISSNHPGHQMPSKDPMWSQKFLSVSKYPWDVVMSRSNTNWQQY